MNLDKKKALIKEHLEVENGKFILFKSSNSNKKPKSSKNNPDYVCKECGGQLIRGRDGVYGCMHCGLESNIYDQVLRIPTKTDKELAELIKEI